MYSNHIFPITDLPRGLGLNFFSLVWINLVNKAKKLSDAEIVRQFWIFSDLQKHSAGKRYGNFIPKGSIRGDIWFDLCNILKNNAKLLFWMLKLNPKMIHTSRLENKLFIYKFKLMNCLWRYQKRQVDFGFVMFKFI